MAFVSLIFTALNLRKLKNALTEEKLEAIRAHEDKTYKVKFKFRHIGVDIRNAFKKFFKKLFKCSETSPGYKTCYKLGREGSCENYVLKSVFGFVGGVFLTYFLYIFFIFQLNIKLTSATVICSFLGCVLTVGLAFSSKVRCVVLLTLPQFFSKRGRQALLAYAFVLALTGPAQNTLNNMGILSESLACGQEQLKQAVKQIIDVIKKPFMAIKEAIKKVVKTVKEVVKKIKEILLKIKRMVMALVRVIKSVFEFLGKMINICNKELGTPFERCTRVFENAITDCNAKLGPLFNWLCSLTYIVKAVCYIVKIFDYVCMMVDFISDSVVGVIIRKVKIFVRHIKTMFYVRIKFSHSFQYETVSSKSMTQIAKEIVAEIKDRSRGIVAFFKFMTSASMLFFLYLVFQVTYYRIKYLTSERYDNIYITKYFREIDQRRAKVGKETVLPLTKKEQQTYVPISSASLARNERRNLSKAATSLATASVKLGTHIVTDYTLYWILTLISYHARYQSKIQAPNLPVAHISGEGFLASLLRSVVNAFQPVGIKLEIDTIPCLPIPIPPDFDRYAQIGITVVICWILTVLEPYGLRFRNYIMGYYHPIRAKQRTIWLYNHILRSRMSFLLLARRKLRKKFGKGGADEMSCKDLLRSRLNCCIFRICFGGDLQKTCLLCGEVFREKEKTRFIKCRTPGCPGLFCLECFADLKNICPVCLSPLEYGDLDDLDEEKDSSGDEPPPPPKKKRKCPWLPCGKPEDDDDEKPLMPDEDDETHKEMEEEESEPEKKVDEKYDFEERAEESDSSTDYSYSYQYDEDQEPLPEPVAWRDVEQQATIDEASMQSFREDEECINIDLHNKIKVPKGHAAMVRMDVVAEVDEEPCDEEDLDYADERVEADETKPLLEHCTCSAIPKRVDFIGVPETVSDIRKAVRHVSDLLSLDLECICSDEDPPLQSTMSTSTRSDCKYCKCPRIQSTLKAGSDTETELRNVVPKLDLSFLEEKDEKCTCDNPALSSRFSYVTYQAICECPISNRSLESSSILSGLNKSPALRRRNMKLQDRPPSIDSSSSDREERPLINANTQYSTPETESPSSMDSFEFNRAQNRRVRQYYEATNQMCIDPGCGYRVNRRSIKNMFERLLPKRYRGQDYLPLHKRDIDDAVQIQSFKYNQENWDTVSLETDSPTYPFETQISSDTSEEERQLLGGRRIRGGECTHLINCRLIGRECPQRRVRTFDAKSELILGRTKLKDFSTLSLPSKPKPANSKEFFSRYFFNIEDLKPRISIEQLMIPVEVPERLVESQENSSEYINQNSSSSSDSGLSESTCSAIFGTPCPEGLIKASKELPEISEERLSDITHRSRIGSTQSSKQQEDSNLLNTEEDTLRRADITEKRTGSTEFSENQASNPSLIGKEPSHIVKESSVGRIKTGSTELEKTTFGASKGSLIGKEPSLIVKEISVERIRTGSTDLEQPTFREKEKSQISISSAKSITSHEARFSKEKDILGLPAFNNKEASSSTQIAKVHPKRKSAQLNQLLYKDEKTEISLVQQLRPYKGVDNSQTVSTNISPRPTPAVKLQISLHNSIISEEETFDLPERNLDTEHIDMRSPQSQDKIVETRDTFPLNSQWIPSDSSRTGKLILSSDKTQQTSDNDIYRTSVSREARVAVDSSPSSSSPAHTQMYTTDPSSTSSRPYYVHELPERDQCQNNCTCLICNERRMVSSREIPAHEQEYNCTCCRCTNALGNRNMEAERFIPQAPRPRNIDYHIKAFPPSTTDTEVPDFLPPPPPRPPHLVRRPPRRSAPQTRHSLYRRPYCEQCNCCQARCHNFNLAGHSRPSTSYYGYQEDYDAEEYDPDSSLSDLPYQNNDEYLHLVHELQDTLHSRNRTRVKRAMKEFENRSKQNQPLEKPIIDYDETSESEEPIIRKIDQLRTDRKICCAEDKCNCGTNKDAARYPKHRGARRRERLDIDERPSHWTMDPGSGEWHKAGKHSKHRGPKGSKDQAEFSDCLCNCERRYQ